MATGEKQCVICHICSVCGESIRHPRSYIKRRSLSALLKARAVRVVRSAVGHHEQAGAAAQTGVGGTSCRNAWLDSGLGGGVCLFDKKSSVRKENKQSGVLLLQSQRKSCY